MQINIPTDIPNFFPTDQPAATPAPVANDEILPPFAAGQTWYVCQGYHGKISHSTVLAFDLTVETTWGHDGCLGNLDASKGMAVYAPATGTAHRQGPDKEFVCVSKQGGGSLYVGHLDPGSRIADGSPVTAGATVLGTVRSSSPSTAQGGYAHIHVEAHASTDCSGGTVPFTADKGFRFVGSPDFTNSGAVNQWQGTALSR